MTESSSDILTWHKFVSMYAKTHNITHTAAMKECSGPDGVWAKYKQEHGSVKKEVKPKEPGGSKVVKKDGAPAVKVVKPKVVRKVAPKKAKVKKTDVVKVAKPPKGKKLVVTYVDNSSSSDEEVVYDYAAQASAKLEVVESDEEE